MTRAARGGDGDSGSSEKFKAAAKLQKALRGGAAALAPSSLLSSSGCLGGEKRQRQKGGVPVRRCVSKRCRARVLRDSETARAKALCGAGCGGCERAPEGGRARRDPGAVEKPCF